MADSPPEKLVDRLTAKFIKSKGDIKVVMTELLKSPEFRDPKYFNAKYKSPFRYVVSTIRAANVQPRDYKPLERFLRQQGMPLYGCLTPDGYKNTRVAWLNPDSLVRRTSFANGLATGKYKGSEGSAVDWQQLSTTLGETLSPNTQEVVSKAPPDLKSALVLGSPDFMRY